MLFRSKYSIIYIFYILFSLAIIGMIYFLDKGETIKTEDMYLYWIFIGLSVFSIILSFFIEKILLSSVQRKEELTSDTWDNIYLQINIFKWALVEAVVIYGLVLFFITGDSSKSLPISLVGFLFLLLHRPSQRSI